MFKMKKFAAIAAAAVMAVSSMSICVFAANLDKTYSFEFDGYGGVEFSSSATKGNNNNYARVTAENGYLTSSSYVTVCVSSTNTGTGTSVSQSQQLTYLSPSEYSLAYTVSRGSGSLNYLAGYGSYYAADVSGYWEP